MSLKDFFKQKQHIENTIDSRFINKYGVYFLLATNGFPFRVGLPILETVQRGVSTSSSYAQDGLRQTIYHPARRDKVRKAPIITDVSCDMQKVIVHHVYPNGKHFLIEFKNVHKVGQPTGFVFSIELNDGRIVSFGMDKKIENAWRSLGFNPQFVLNVFRDLFLNKTWQVAFSKRYTCPNCGQQFRGQFPICPSCEATINYNQLDAISQNEIKEIKNKKNNDLKLENQNIKFNEKLDEENTSKSSSIENYNIFKIYCPNCGRQILSDSISCKYCKTILTIQKYQDDIKKQINQIKTKNENSISETTTNNDITQSQEDPLEIIKKSKELFDIGAITQQEFDKIKEKYIDKI